jgi:hypothetical protein
MASRAGRLREHVALGARWPAEPLAAVTEAEAALAGAAARVREGCALATRLHKRLAPPADMDGAGAAGPHGRGGGVQLPQALRAGMPKGLFRTAGSTG